MAASTGPSGQTTALLLARLREGDARAADLLVRRVEPLLQRWAHGRLPAQLRDAQDTADLVQHALMRVLPRIGQFQPEHAGALYAYLRQTVLNTLRDALRERRQQPSRAGEEALDVLPAAPGSALEASLGRDGAIAYEQLLQQLPPHHQALVVMRFEFGMSFPEIAAELGESADGVRTKLNRVLRRMAEALGGSDA